MASATDKMILARRHLERVQDAAWDTIDWAAISVFGFYALEAAVDAACLHFGKESQQSHWRRVDAAKRLSSEHGLDDVSDLLRDLNEVRKNEVYGDVVAPELDAQDVTTTIERYVDAIGVLVEER